MSVLVETPKNFCDLPLLEPGVTVGLVSAVGEESHAERKRESRVESVVVPCVLEVTRPRTKLSLVSPHVASLST